MFIGTGGCKPARGRFKLRSQHRSKLSVTRPFGNKVLSLLVNAAIALHARVRGQSDYPANAVTARCTPDNSRLSTSAFDFPSKFAPFFHFTFDFLRNLHLFSLIFDFFRNSRLSSSTFNFLQNFPPFLPASNFL